MTAPGQDFTLDPDTWWGERDHSWGTRPLPNAHGEPPAERPDWKLLMFAPLQLPEFGVHFYLYESAPGRPVHLSAGLVHRSGGFDDVMITGVEHDLRWVSGAPAPTLEGGRITLRLDDGRDLDLELTAQPGRAHLRGGGYGGWNGWYQGHWKGEQSLEHDVWDLADRDLFYRHARNSSDHLVEVRHDGQVGYGIVEYILLPGYGRYEDGIPVRPDSSR